MKIGLVTVPFNNNYGGFLQAFALKSLLIQRGHDVEIVNRRRNRPGLKWRIKNYLSSKLHGIKSWYEEQQEIKRKGKETRKFVKRYLHPITRPFYTSKDLSSFVKKKKYDIFVFGSDQIWRYKFCPQNIEDYFGGFISKEDRTPHFSYAASFGSADFEYNSEKQQICSTLLEQFQAVSVREKSGIELLQKYFGYNKIIYHVLDPTLVLDKGYYLKMINKKWKGTNDYLLTYILDTKEDIKDAINILLKQLNLQIETIQAQTGNIWTLPPLSPVEVWLSKIYYSDFVFTDSFHGVVFSIIFHKPFYVYINKERGADRFISLLSLLHLEDRLIESSGEINTDKFSSIDWDKVEKLLSEYKSESLHFLDSAVKNCENQ